MTKAEEKKLKPKDAFPAEAVKRTVQKFPGPEEEAGVGALSPLTFFLASAADPILDWGIDTHVRDTQLEEFWKKESFLSGAIFNLSVGRAALEWDIEAPPRTQEALSLMLHNAQANDTTFGWEPFISTISQELLTRDNGAFIELIRADRRKGPKSPVIGLARLDSLRCFRTGNPQVPVIYEDEKNIRHKMPWWSIIPIASMPSAVKEMRGVGLCATSRVVRMSQILRSIAIYKDEKISGRFHKAIHFVGGVSKSEIEDIMARGDERADNAGQRRYILPQIVASLDPEKPVSTDTISLADLPDNFNMDEEMKWYITAIALNTGEDYQTFAPLPSGNMGSGLQSEVLHRKSSGKGPAHFMKTLESIFKYRGVMPANATFTFRAKDLTEEAEQESLNKTLSENLAILVWAKILTPEAARVILVEKNLLDEDVKKLIPEDFGLDLNPGGPDANIASDMNDTVADDIGRVEKALRAIRESIGLG